MAKSAAPAAEMAIREKSTPGPLATGGRRYSDSLNEERRSPTTTGTRAAA